VRHRHTQLFHTRGKLNSIWVVRLGRLGWKKLPMRQAGDEAVGVGDGGRLLDLRPAGSGAAVSDVRQNIRGKQGGLLQHTVCESLNDVEVWKRGRMPLRWD